MRAGVRRARVRASHILRNRVFHVQRPESRAAKNDYFNESIQHSVPLARDKSRHS